MIGGGATLSLYALAHIRMISPSLTPPVVLLAVAVGRRRTVSTGSRLALGPLSLPSAILHISSPVDPTHTLRAWPVVVVCKLATPCSPPSLKYEDPSVRV